MVGWLESVYRDIGERRMSTFFALPYYTHTNTLCARNHGALYAVSVSLSSVSLLPFNASSCIPFCMYRNPIISPSRKVVGSMLFEEEDEEKDDASRDDSDDDDDDESNASPNVDAPFHLLRCR